MADLEITGTEAFIKVARALNAQGSGGLGLKRELRRNIEDAAEPLVNEVRDQIALYLPDRYAAVLARDLVVKQSWSTRGASAGLKLTGHAKGITRRRHVRQINLGNLRHKVYGNPTVWVDQSVRPGFWDDPLTGSREKVATAIRRAIQRAARQISRGS